LKFVEIYYLVDREVRTVFATGLLNRIIKAYTSFNYYSFCNNLINSNFKINYHPRYTLEES